MSFSKIVAMFFILVVTATGGLTLWKTLSGDTCKDGKITGDSKKMLMGAGIAAIVGGLLALVLVYSMYTR
jgi:hypothetical protein